MGKITDILGKKDTFSRSGVYHESDVELVIRIDTEENFKKGMHELREQMNHLVMVYSDAFRKYNELHETYEKAVTNFTQEGDPEYVTFVEHIPKHLAKE